ncbi:MAG: O-antigen ligase family protein [Lentimicrobiaceae bacterium]|nr:O-antigen ligase family protein [Lentimicrobiaceae bacterium]
MNRILFERILVFIFVLSWVNFPKIVYDKFSWDFMTAYHGKNLFPFLLPIILLFVIYAYLRSDWSARYKNSFIGFFTMLINRSTIADQLLIILVCYMVLINYLTAIIDQSDANFRMVLPIITAHFFYFFYTRYSQLSIIDNINTYFYKCVVFSIFLILILQLLMFSGVIPGLTGIYSPEINEKIFSGIRVDGGHIGYTSYLGTILLYLMIFHSKKLPIYYRTAVYLTLFSVLIINQTRGALLIAIIMLFSYFISLKNIKIFIAALSVVILLLVVFWFLNVDVSTHRLFTYDSSTEARLYLMTETFDVFTEKPLFGHGSYFVENLRFGKTVDQQIVHNYYLRFLTSYGLIGFSIFLYYFKHLFANKLSFVNIMGLFVIFSIFTFEPYLMWSIYIIAIFSRIDQKKKLYTT